MISFVMAFITAALIYCYWIACRERSLEARRELVELIVALEARDSVPDQEKEIAQWVYRAAKSWFFMPAMTVLAVPALFFRLFHKQERSSPEYREKIMKAAIMMYVARNPLTSVVCLPVFAVAAAITGAAGVLANTVREIPTTSSVYGTIAERASHR